MTECRAEGVTGILRVAGNPGGLFHLRKGVVVAVDSPGAPGAEALLLRSGRISEDDWTAALRETAEGDVDLGALGGVGVAELRVVAEMAARDGAFAIAAGVVDEHVVDPTPVDVLVVGGIEPADLLGETLRRVDAMDALPFPLSPYRERVMPATEAPTGLAAEQREILASANGRRTARDIAFAVGRGVYPVMVEISRMLSAGVLQIAPDAPKAKSQGRIKSLRPRHRAEDATERNHIGL
jgi:hypothetical protein